MVTRLGSLGVPPENIFLLPTESKSEGPIGFWHPDVGFRYLILESDELAKACYTYLLNRGARRFDTDEELYRAAAVEKWPGWDTCDDAVRARRLSGSA